MVSINTLKCNIPRPKTINLSASSVSCTRRARFFSSSFIKRSRKLRLVTNLPSRPKNGELLIPNCMFIVGSSIGITSNASGFSKSAIVSPIWNPSIPTTAQISPAETSVTFFLPIPSNVYSSFTLLFVIVPSRRHNCTFCPSLIIPRAIRPMAIRPRKVE